MTTAQAPITIYTDGAARLTRYPNGEPALRETAWGWLAVNAPRGWSTAAIEGYQEHTRATHNTNVLMESRALVKAIAEFAPLGRKLLLKADCRALPQVIAKYRAGEVGAEVFFSNPNLITAADARQLLPLLDTVDFEIQWVKAHFGTFENLVLDQALRQVAYEDMTATDALDFIADSLVQEECVIYGNYKINGEWRKTYQRVTPYNVPNAA